MTRGTDIEPQDGRTDEQLMLAHTKGDHGAFPELFRRWARRLFGYLYHMTNDRELAQDLVQDVFTRVHRSRKAFDPKRSFRPWIFRIAANAGADSSRSWFTRLARRSRSLFDPVSPEGAEVWERLAGRESLQPERQAADRDASIALRRALGRLRESHRQAVVLHDLEGLSCREIAELTGKPLATILSWVQRGRTELRTVLEAEGGSSAWL